MKKLLCSLLLLMILISCSSKEDNGYRRCTPKYKFADQTAYNIVVSAKTPKGIEVDTSGLNINLFKIDRLTDEVEQCLSQIGILTDEAVKTGQCVSSAFELPIHRECLVVKVAADWKLSQYEYGGTKHQQLPYTNGGMCTNKGLPAGVCYYRVGIQDDLTIVVPPSFYLYKDALVRIVTGCYNPWYADALAVCMEPTTNPLGDGSEP